MNNYYNEYAKDFFEGTAYVDMHNQYKDFLTQIPKGGSILDAGCGSGRDSLGFKKLGYEVVALDGSKEMCKLASEFIGQEVLNLQFHQIDFKEAFDGIWACASLLHVPSPEIEDVLIKLKDSLKEEGILYASFKYGTFEGVRDGRYFLNLTEEKAEALFTQVGFSIEKIWLTGDVREGRGEERWLNLIVKNLSSKAFCK